MKANALMKANVDAVLKARHQTREDLSKWCRREVSWASKILNSPTRWFPMKYWDKISDFVGLSPYQLLQPGIAPLHERRGRERRSGRDRRVRGVEHHVRESISQLVSTLTQDDVALLLQVRSLGPDDRDLVRKSLAALPRRRTKREPKKPSGDAYES